MTRARKAEVLLCLAKHWQNGVSASDCCGTLGELQEVFPDDAVRAMAKDYLDEWNRLDEYASAALSGVCGLGYEVESVSDEEPS